jgi:hypothetical protein
MDIELSAPYYRLQAARCLCFDSGSTGGRFSMVDGRAGDTLRINDIRLSRRSQTFIGAVVAGSKAMLATSRYNSGPALPGAVLDNQVSRRSAIGRGLICG